MMVERKFGFEVDWKTGVREGYTAEENIYSFFLFDDSIHLFDGAFVPVLPS